MTEQEKQYCENDVKLTHELYKQYNEYRMNHRKKVLLWLCLILLCIAFWTCIIMLIML